MRRIWIWQPKWFHWIRIARIVYRVFYMLPRGILSLPIGICFFRWALSFCLWVLVFISKYRYRAHNAALNNFRRTSLTLWYMIWSLRWVPLLWEVKFWQAVSWRGNRRRKISISWRSLMNVSIYQCFWTGYWCWHSWMKVIWSWIRKKFLCVRWWMIYWLRYLWKPVRK